MEICSDSLGDPDPNEERDPKRDDSHGAPSGTSLLQAIRCKYCSEPENDASHQVLAASAAGIHVHVQETAPSLKPGFILVNIIVYSSVTSVIRTPRLFKHFASLCMKYM